MFVIDHPRQQFEVAGRGLDQGRNSLVDNLAQRRQATGRVNGHQTAGQERQEERGDGQIERQAREQRHYRGEVADVGGVREAEILTEPSVGDWHAFGQAGGPGGVDHVGEVVGA